jgi:uncharacterized protein
VTRTILDTGPLVAALNRRDRHHAWASQAFHSVPAPMFTCEPVLAEACHLVRGLPGGGDAILQLLERGLLEVSLAVADEVGPIRKLMKKYHEAPMSLADACLVRMTELDRRCTVLTVDSDFHVYRRNGRHVIPTITPF